MNLFLRQVFWLAFSGMLLHLKEIALANILFTLNVEEQAIHSTISINEKETALANLELLPNQAWRMSPEHEGWVTHGQVSQVSYCT